MKITQIKKALQKIEQDCKYRDEMDVFVDTDEFYTQVKGLMKALEWVNDEGETNVTGMPG